VFSKPERETIKGIRKGRVELTDEAIIFSSFKGERVNDRESGRAWLILCAYAITRERNKKQVHNVCERKYSYVLGRKKGKRSNWIGFDVRKTHVGGIPFFWERKKKKKPEN